MTVKNFPKVSLFIGLVFALCIQTAGPVAADDGKETPSKQKNDYIGSVTSTIRSNPLPMSRRTLPGFTTNATNNTPGGGYAYANSSLGWTSLRMDGTAQTGLVGTTLVFTLNAHSVQVYRAGAPKGGAGPNWGSGSGGASVSVTKSVYEWVYGSQWRLDTSHRVDGNGFLWTPTNTIYATP